MLHAGLDLSRRRLDFHVLDQGGETVHAALYDDGNVKVVPVSIDFQRSE